MLLWFSELFLFEIEGKFSYMGMPSYMWAFPKLKGHWTKSTIIASIRWNENFKWFFLPPLVPPTIQARKQCWKVAWNHFFLHKSLSQCPPTTQPLLQYCSILVFRYLTFNISPESYAQCTYKSWHYESFSDVGESWVWLRADFQSGSRVF